MSGKARELALFIAGTLAGWVRQEHNGSLSFTYVPGYAGAPVSVAMPISSEPYQQRVVCPFLMGLLPDDPQVRADIGERYGCAGENPLALLAHIGLDCPGAVQFVPTDGADNIELMTTNVGELRELSDIDVEERLRLLLERQSSPWTGSCSPKATWTLAGAQEKMALCRYGGRWYAPAGSAATTHILKPGVVGYAHEALDEYLCQETAREIGLKAARCSLETFGSTTAIVVERYDRIVESDGTVTRLHQEDLCQALGVDSSRKYADQGGPSTPDVLWLLARTGEHAADNLRAFVLYLLFNYLVGATDAHAKNYSLLLDETGDVRLAPLYDVASIGPYEPLLPRRRRPLRAAMSVGGENRFGMLGRGALRKLAADPHLVTYDITHAWIENSARGMAEAIPAALHEVVARAKEAGLPGIDFIAARLETEIDANCKRFIELL